MGDGRVAADRNAAGVLVKRRDGPWNTSYVELCNVNPEPLVNGVSRVRA